VIGFHSGRFMDRWGYLALAVIMFSFFAVLSRACAQTNSYPMGYNSPFAFGGTYASGASEQKKVSVGPGQGGIQLGPLRITPGISVGTTYTSNAQMQNSSQQSSFLATINPTFDVAVDQGLKVRDYITFGYTGNLGAYTQVTNNDFTSHTLWANVNLMERPTAYIRLREAITYTNNPYGNQQFIGQGVANTRMVNQTDFTVGRNLPRDYSVELGYQNLWQNYFENTYESQSSLTNTLNPTLLYEVSEKTKLLAQYSISYWNYYDQPSEFGANYFVNQALTGVRWAPTGRLSGELKGGYAWQNYSNKTDALGIPYPNQSAPIYSFNVQYMISPKTSAAFQAARQYYFGGDLNPTSNRLDVYQDGYLANAFELRLTNKPRPDMSVSVFMDYELDQYAKTRIYPDRNDTFYGAGVTFSQQFRRHFSWGLTYTYQNRDSQLPGNSYAVSMVSANLGASY